MKFDPSVLQAGDVILYRPSPLKKGVVGWFFGQLIKFKTWTNISHVEVYAGGGESLASRDGQGVQKYPLRETEVAYVLRSISPLDHAKMMAWFYSKAQGQKYDFLGLACFAYAVRKGATDRMFCSEFATRLYDKGYDIRLFGPLWDADHTAPATILASKELSVEVYRDGKPLWK